MISVISSLIRGMLYLCITTLLFSSCSLLGLEEEEEETSTSSNSASTGSCRGRSGGVKDSSASLPNLKLPYPTGKSHVVGQGWGGDFTHYREGREHAIDFRMAEGVDTISAVGPGRVIAVKEDSNTNCITAGIPLSACTDAANYVYVDHGKGYLGRYVHFCQNCVAVNPGDVLTGGNYNLGYAGNTGYSGRPHLHFEMFDFEENCSVKYKLEGISGESYTAGQSYSSTNTASENWNDSNLSKYTGKVFSARGIELTSEIPWYAQVGESLPIAGKITDGKPAVTVFLIPESLGNVRISGSAQTKTATNGTFNFTYQVPSVSPGLYRLGISSSSGTSWGYTKAPLFLIY